jgi:hypothetical protein
MVQPKAKFCGHDYKPGAPFTYVMTRRFLEVFGFALRERPVLERLEEEGLLQGRGPTPISTGCWGSPKRTRRFSTMTRRLTRLTRPELLEPAPRRRRRSFKFLQMAHDLYERILVERR